MNAKNPLIISHIVIELNISVLLRPAINEPNIWSNDSELISVLHFLHRAKKQFNEKYSKNPKVSFIPVSRPKLTEISNRKIGKRVSRFFASIFVSPYHGNPINGATTK